MLEQTFRNIDDIPRKDAGCTSELDYTERSSWLLFLKYLDALERNRASEALLEGRAYFHKLGLRFRWEAWAAPKANDGRLDHNTALTSDDLRDFFNHRLFPYLACFKQRASGPNTIDYKIGEIKSRIQSGYNLRDVVQRVDELRFDTQQPRARQALAPHLPQVGPVIDLLVPMDTEQAEAFATVHAARNNLLTDNAAITDNAIVSAAREDGHPDKLKIAKHKFRTAIALIRQKGLVPDGTAKYVGGQRSLPL